MTTTKKRGRPHKTKTIDWAAFPDVGDVNDIHEHTGRPHARIRAAFANGSLAGLPGKRGVGSRHTRDDVKAWVEPDLKADEFTVDAAALVVGLPSEKIEQALASAHLDTIDGTPVGKIRRADLLAWISKGGAR